MPFWKKEKNPVEERMEEVAQLWANTTPNTPEWFQYQNMYLELEEHNLERLKVQKDGQIDAKTWLGTATTIGLALLTLNYERFDTIRSKAAQLWLRRRDR